MTIKEHIIESTQKAAQALYETAKAVPQDKVAWSPLDMGRTVLSQAQECAQSPLWSIGIMQDRVMPDFTEETMAKYRAEREQWTTVEQCEQACLANMEKLFRTIREFPDEHLEETIQMFGRYWTFREVMCIHLWNCTYHEGQVNYIQTLYGDNKMH